MGMAKVDNLGLLFIFIHISMVDKKHTQLNKQTDNRQTKYKFTPIGVDNPRFDNPLFNEHPDQQQGKGCSVGLQQSKLSASGEFCCRSR